MKLRAFFSLLLFLQLALFGETAYCEEIQVAIPSGWCYPSDAELDSQWRRRSPDRFALAKGDFDGDGTVDQALLLVMCKGRQVGLFAILSSSSSNKPKLLVRDKSPLDIQVMGISVVKAGTYPTACGKGYWDCEKGEPTEIGMKADAIEYFKTEGASSYFYWDKSVKRLKRIWITD